MDLLKTPTPASRRVWEEENPRSYKVSGITAMLTIAGEVRRTQAKPSHRADRPYKIFHLFIYRQEKPLLQNQKVHVAVDTRIAPV
jgi:hypothetical protein